jgi:dienelactone hydrolase
MTLDQVGAWFVGFAMGGAYVWLFATAERWRRAYNEAVRRADGIHHRETEEIQVIEL